MKSPDRMRTTTGMAIIHRYPTLQTVSLKNHSPRKSRRKFKSADSGNPDRIFIIQVSLLGSFSKPCPGILPAELQLTAPTRY